MTRALGFLDLVDQRETEKQTPIAKSREYASVPFSALDLLAGFIAPRDDQGERKEHAFAVFDELRSGQLPAKDVRKRLSEFRSKAVGSRSQGKRAAKDFEQSAIAWLKANLSVLSPDLPVDLLLAVPKQIWFIDAIILRSDQITNPEEKPQSVAESDGVIIKALSQRAPMALLRTLLAEAAFAATFLKSVWIVIPSSRPTQEPDYQPTEEATFRLKQAIQENQIRGVGLISLNFDSDIPNVDMALSPLPGHLAYRRAAQIEKRDDLDVR